MDFEAGTILWIFLYIIHKFGLWVQLWEKLEPMGSCEDFGDFPFPVHGVPRGNMVSTWEDSEIAKDIGKIREFC